MVIRPPENSLLRVLLGRWGQTGFASSCLHQTQRCSGRVGGGGGRSSPGAGGRGGSGGEHARRGLGVSERRGQRAHRPPTSAVSPPGALRRPGRLSRSGEKLPGGKPPRACPIGAAAPWVALSFPPHPPQGLNSAKQRAGRGGRTRRSRRLGGSRGKALVGIRPMEARSVTPGSRASRAGAPCPSPVCVWGAWGGTEGGNGTRTIARRPGLSGTHRQAWGEAGGGWVGGKM